LDKVKGLINNREMVAVSLAPSWRGGTGYNRSRIIATLKALGVALIGETALGAESVSMGTAKYLNQSDPGLYISTCCPVVVDFIRLYKPSFVKSLVPLATPAMTHARLLKDYYGEELKVVFVGPCVAKKGEADNHPELLSAALTFGELKRWFRDGQFDEDVLPIDEEATFSPERSFEGALYPLSGGMIAGLNKIGLKDSVQTVSINTLELLDKSLDDLGNSEYKTPVFVEAMACSGGCVNGPAISGSRSTVLAMADLLRHVKHRQKANPEAPYTHLKDEFWPVSKVKGGYTFEAIQEVMAQLGKYHPEDEMNCSGCGYSSCRELASAILEGLAEPQMCVSSMRKLATRKAAALVKAMPSAIVMVDRQMNILEVNESFIRMFTGDQAGKYLGNLDGLVGSPVIDWIEFGGLIRKVLMTGEDIQIEHRLYKGKLYNVHIFSVDKFRVAGAIVTDMTSLREGRTDLARKVREVINKNISTVQEIACLLGEHMVETETILAAVAAEYEEVDEPEFMVGEGSDRAGGR
jgi:PAS domain-containing protein